MQVVESWGPQRHPPSRVPVGASPVDEIGEPGYQGLVHFCAPEAEASGKGKSFAGSEKTSTLPTRNAPYPTQRSLRGHLCCQGDFLGSRPLIRA